MQNAVAEGVNVTKSLDVETSEQNVNKVTTTTTSAMESRVLQEPASAQVAMHRDLPLVRCSGVDGEKDESGMRI